jgi:hypothetical protein
MRFPHASTQSPPDSFYGLGLLISNYKGVRLVWHNGEVAGYLSTLVTVPEYDFAIALLFNANTYDPTVAAFGVLDHLLELPEVPAPDWSTPSSDWIRYVGTYAFPDDLTVFPPPAATGTAEIVLRNGAMWVSASALPEPSKLYPLRQIARDTWWLDIEGDGIPVTFWRDRLGRAKYLSSQYFGVAERVDYFSRTF